MSEPSTYVSQVGGSHYESAYQHWDLIADLNAGYLEANATKYMCRAHKKNGIEDIRKAVTYVRKLQALINAGYVRERTGFWGLILNVTAGIRNLGRRRTPTYMRGVEYFGDHIQMFLTESSVPSRVHKMFRGTLSWKTVGDLYQVEADLNSLVVELATHVNTEKPVL
jgi:hypothetical protein